MADSDDILRQADRLMGRHRVFVAAGARAAPAEPPVEAEELPVLTEVVDTGGETPPQGPDVIEARARELLYEQLPVQRQALAAELSAWLDQELPQVVLRVLDGFADQLVAQVTAEAKADLLSRLQGVLETEQPPASPDESAPPGPV